MSRNNVTYVEPEVALSAILRSSLPAVITEGRDDYRIMRKIENKLQDLNVDFLPLGNRDAVLWVWRNLSEEAALRTVAFVDLDNWLYTNIPHEYQGDNIFYTLGYSIENDIYINGNLENLCDENEIVELRNEIALIAVHHAVEIEKIILGEPFKLSISVNKLLNDGFPKNISIFADNYAGLLNRHYTQILRGKNLFEILVRQLNRDGRFAKIGYKALYEIGSYQLNEIFSNLENNFRLYFSDQRI